MGAKTLPRIDNRFKTWLTILMISALLITLFGSWANEVSPLYASVRGSSDEGPFSTYGLPIIFTLIGCMAVWDESIAKFIGYLGRYVGIPLLIIEFLLLYVFESPVWAENPSIFLIFTIIAADDALILAVLIMSAFIWIVFNLSASAISMAKVDATSTDLIRAEMQFGTYTFFTSVLAIIANIVIFLAVFNERWIAPIHKLPTLGYLVIFLLLVWKTWKFVPAWFGRSWQKQDEPSD